MSNQNDKLQPKLYFMSKATTTKADNRTWIWLEPGVGSFTIRIFPVSDLTDEIFVCDCPDPGDDCEHIKQTEIADRQKFTKRSYTKYEKTN